MGSMPRMNVYAMGQGTPAPPAGCSQQTEEHGTVLQGWVLAGRNDDGGEQVSKQEKQLLSIAVVQVGEQTTGRRCWKGWDTLLSL